MTPAQLTSEVVSRFDATPDPRLREIMQSLVRHLHGCVVDVHLTRDEWVAAIDFLTATGKKCEGERQEFILLSDTLGISMLVDAIARVPEGAPTETTVLGPFYAPNSPLRAFGASIAERPSGDQAWISGHIIDTNGTPIPEAELDVWQNGADGLYAVQDPTAPSTNLRGIIRAREDGSYAFIAVRPTAYAIPADGPVGSMLAATGRHPWRPAHLHVIARAPGHHSVATHIFDDESDYLESDAVFGVKSSLVRHFVRHEAGTDDPPAGIDPEQPWYSLAFDVILEPARARS